MFRPHGRWLDISLSPDVVPHFDIRNTDVEGLLLIGVIG